MRTQASSASTSCRFFAAICFFLSSCASLRVFFASANLGATVKATADIAPITQQHNNTVWIHVLPLLKNTKKG